MDGPSLTAAIPEDAYGLDANRVLEELMEVSDRPLKVKDDLQTLFVMSEGDLAPARKFVDELRQRIHTDPALTKADMLIRRKETLGK